MGRDREERSKEERRQRWMDGQIKQRQQPLDRGLTSHARRDVKGNRFGSEGLKGIQTKGERRRMEVEDSGCQDWRWDGVRSHLCLLLSPLCPITATMKQAPSCRAAYGSPVVKPSLQSGAMQF